MLDYRIETFLALYKEMNYRKTAEKLNMTQPGVTQHIKYLEKYYGVKLFTYDGKQLYRTEYAEALKKHIESIIAKERILIEALDKPKYTHLDIGVTKTVGEFVLNESLQKFVSKPDHTVNYVIDNTEMLLQLLEKGKLDFSVIEGVFDKSKYPHHLYKKEFFIGICAKNHPFAGKTVSISDIFKETLILSEAGSGTRQLLEQAICNLGYSMDNFKRCLYVNNFSVIRDLVESGIGVSCAYAPVVNKDSKLSTFTVEDIHITAEFNFVYCDEELAMKKIKLFFGDNSFNII